MNNFCFTVTTFIILNLQGRIINIFNYSGFLQVQFVTTWPNLIPALHFWNLCKKNNSCNLEKIGLRFIILRVIWKVIDSLTAKAS